MRVHLELLGLPRLIAGVKEISLDVEENATFRDVVRILGNKYPKMIGSIIQPDGETLHPPNIFNFNARRMIQTSQMDDSLNDGDRIILMSMSAGG